MQIMDSVFTLHHAHPAGDDARDVKLIGVYRSKLEAEAAIQRVADKPGFRDMPEGFEIDEFKLDETDWLDGYMVEGDTCVPPRG